MKKRKAKGKPPLPKKPRTGDYINCTICGTEFYRQPAYIKQGRHLCSLECNKAWQARNQVTKTCPQCGKEFKVSQSKIGITHCSRKCEQTSRIKRPTGRTHNGRAVLLNSQGYLTLYEPDHPNAHTNGRVLEHRLVMEEELGRLLESDEHVHHINRDKQDNRPENLEIMNPSEHSQETNRHARRKIRKMKQELAEYRRLYGPLGEEE